MKGIVRGGGERVGGSFEAGRGRGTGPKVCFQETLRGRGERER